MKKKLASLLMTLALVVVAVTPVYAADTIVNSSDNGGNPGTSKNCTVTATIDSSWSVKLPSSLALTSSDNTNFTGEYTVGAKGNIQSDKYVSIVPAASFTMTGTKDGSHQQTASTSQTIQKFVYGAASQADEKTIGTSTYATTTGEVTVTLTDADVYEGTLAFTYELKTK